MVTTAMRCFLLSRRRRAPRPVGAVSVVPRWTGWPPRLTPAARTHPGVGRDRGERAVMRACEVVPLAWDATGSVRDRPQWKRTGHRLSTGREFTVGDQVVRRHLAGMNLIPKLLATIALSLTTTPIASAAPPPPAAWPLQPRPEVVRGFELPAKPWLPGHRGIDLLGAPGQPVLAATSGTITYAGQLAGRGVVVVSSGARRTTYEPVVPVLAVGTAVQPGHCHRSPVSRGLSLLPKGLSALGSYPRRAV